MSKSNMSNKANAFIPRAAIFIFVYNADISSYVYTAAKFIYVYTADMI